MRLRFSLSSARRRVSLSALLCALALLLTLSAPAAASTAESEESVSLETAPASEDIAAELPADAFPLPDPDCYGSVPIENASDVEAVIRRARASGLLGDGETVAFRPDLSFYRGLYHRDIEYYLDDSILVLLWKEDIEGKCCTFAEVKITDPAQFGRKLADDTYGSEHEYFATVLAEQTGAVVAMNADFYRHRDFGILVYDRELCRFSTAPYTGPYLQYNCVDTLFVTEDGDFLYKRMGEENTPESIREYVEENDILFSVAFGPVLVENGEAVPCEWYPVGEVNQGYSRAGIGRMGPGHYLYMSLNHGSQEARWTVTQFAQHFAEKPVETAYCLDGGQTGEVVFRGEPYNYIDFGLERPVSDILYFTRLPG